jgi:hypothetical protein
MTACTQPGCAGTIVDGYCDVCGSPAGAPPPVPAGGADSAASPAPATEPGLTAFRRGSEFPSTLRNAGLVTACTLPGCAGTIVDGYCDVCGSPAGAPPPDPGAAASAASPAPAAEPGLTAARRGVVGVPTDGEKIDAARADPPAAATEQANTALAGSDDDDTVEMPRVVSVLSGDRHPLPQLPEQQERADPTATDTQQADDKQADPTATDAQQADEEKELAEDKPDGAQDYRTRVEQAQLPDDVRRAALCEVGNLERTSDESPESVDIRTWLDTILDLPWSTKTTDWIDIQGSREVEATLRRLIEPAVADIEEGGTAEVEPAVADSEKADTAPAGPDDDDTVGLPPVVAGPGLTAVGRGPGFPAKQKNGDLNTACTQPGCTGTIVDGYCDVCGSRAGAAPLVAAGAADSAASPAPAAETGRTAVRRGVLGVCAVLFLLGCAVMVYQVVPGFNTSGSRPTTTASSAPTSAVTQSATPGGVSSTAGQSPASDPRSGSAAEGAIQLEGVADSARPFQPVRIQGSYRGGADAFVQVERWEGGKWLAFPLPTKTDQSGQFTAYVEFGQPGRYQLRVLDPESGVTSEPFAVVIEG